MNTIRRLAVGSLCLALLFTGATASWAQPTPSPNDLGLHLGWANKPNHVEILTQPISQTVVFGQSVAFSV